MKNLRNLFRLLFFIVVLFGLAILSTCQQDDAILPLKSTWTDISFSENLGTVAEENASGIMIHLTLSEPSPVEGIFKIRGPYNNEYFPNDDLYGVVCTTIPEMVNDFYGAYIPVLIPKGARSIDFTVLTIDNATDDPDYKLSFYIRSTAGIFHANGSYTLTVTDNDN